MNCATPWSSRACKNESTANNCQSDAPRVVRSAETIGNGVVAHALRCVGGHGRRRRTNAAIGVALNEIRRRGNTRQRVASQHEQLARLSASLWRRRFIHSGDAVCAAVREFAHRVGVLCAQATTTSARQSRARRSETHSSVESKKINREQTKRCVPSTWRRTPKAR
jgi:hypothetical protein